MHPTPILLPVLPAEFQEFLAKNPEHIAGTEHVGDPRVGGDDYSAVVLDQQTISAFLVWLLATGRPGLAVSVIRRVGMTTQVTAEAVACGREVIAEILRHYPDAGQPGAA